MTILTVLLQSVVWERLSDVSGNTEFVKADFSSFTGQPAPQDVKDAADLAQAAFASIVPPKGLSGDEIARPITIGPFIPKTKPVSKLRGPS